MAAPAALLAGCAHREEYRGGSIKDGPSTAYTAPVRAPAKIRRTGRTEQAEFIVLEKTTVAAEPRRSTAAKRKAADAGAGTSEPTGGTLAVVEPAPPVVAAPAAPTAATFTTATAAPAPTPIDRAARSKSDQDARTVSLQLLAEGQRLFSLGKVAEARRRFFAAMEGPVPEVLLALARSFDTHYLSQLQQPDAPPDMTRAQALYERAVERGSPDAKQDLERIRGVAIQPPLPAAAPAAPPAASPAPASPPQR